MYKLIAIDIDGTLLNSKDKISEKTKNTIKEANNMGIDVVLTSGRMSNIVKIFAKEIGANKYLVAENGASIVDLQNDKLIRTRYMNKNTVLKIVDTCLENNIYYMIYTNRVLLVKDLKHMALFFHNQNYTYSPEEKMEIHLGGKKYIEQVNDDFTKVVICDEDRAIYNSIITKLKNIPKIDILTIPHISIKTITVGTKNEKFSYSYAEISAEGANKWNAIMDIADILNIKKEEIIAIGDNINDLKMIQNAGLGVAMENGTPDVKNVADYIAKSNDDDGVAIVIEKYVLNN